MLALLFLLLFLAAPLCACVLASSLFVFIYVFLEVNERAEVFARVSLTHKNTRPSVVSNLASHAAIRAGLEADQIRTGELDLINLVKLLMRPAVAGLSQRVSHSGFA